MNIETAVQKIKLGRAICFLGAGFSRGAVDSEDRPIFGEHELRKELFRVADYPFSDSVTLPDIANYCQKKNDETARILRTTILNRFTLTKPTSDQIEILSQPWRSTFTTNYDDIPEQIWQNEHIQIFSPLEPEKKLLSGRRLFYLHGRGRDIRQSDSDPLLVLSSSDYAKTNKSHQKLRDYFTNETATCEAIIFVGYSARDLDYTRSLASIGGQIKTRTIFIEDPKIDPIDRTRIEEYGSIAAIGTAGFSKVLCETQVPDVLTMRPRLVRELSVVDADRTDLSPVVDYDIHRQFLTGSFDVKGYLAQKQEEQRGERANLSCIERTEKLERTFQLLKKGSNRIVVTADVGNGKTFFLRQVEQRGLDEGYRVFRIDGAGVEYSGELEGLFEKPGKKLFIVDDAVRFRMQIKLIGSRLTSDCGIVISNFNKTDTIGINDLRETIGGQFFEVTVDKMTPKEVELWVEYLNRWGLWGESLAGLSDSDKRNYIIWECNAEFRSTVISIYRQSKLAERITNIVDVFLKNSNDRNNVVSFFGAVITSLVDRHIDWKNVVDWLGINEASLMDTLQGSRIHEILIQKDGRFCLPSRQLARHFLEEKDLGSVSPEDISSIYVDIVLGTARQMSDIRQSGLARQNLKELMRFRILNLLFGSIEEGQHTISFIYNKLSSDTFIQRQDQFWLQFAMARMADNDLPLAEKYLTTAKGIAKSYGQDWDTRQIDDQFTRLRLMKVTQNEHPNIGELEKAISHLKVTLLKIPGDMIYPLRSAKLIHPLLEKHVKKLDQDTLDRLRELLKIMKDEIGSKRKIKNAEHGESEVLRQNILRAQLIVQNL